MSRVREHSGEGAHVWLDDEAFAFLLEMRATECRADGMLVVARLLEGAAQRIRPASVADPTHASPWDGFEFRVHDCEFPVWNAIGSGVEAMRRAQKYANDGRQVQYRIIPQWSTWYPEDGPSTAPTDSETEGGAA